MFSPRKKLPAPKVETNASPLKQNYISPYGQQSPRRIVKKSSPIRYIEEPPKPQTRGATWGQNKDLETTPPKDSPKVEATKVESPKLGFWQKWFKTEDA
jgi:hypothetical protein